MQVLVVGAGALGQVFGGALARAGADVHYLVREAQVARVRAGFRLHRLRVAGRPQARAFVPAAAYGEPVAAGQMTWDAVWLCVPSPALRGPWVEALRDQVGAATVVTIGQDLGDLASLQRAWPAEQIVQVLPSLVAFQSPPGHQHLPEGEIAYWVPPGAALSVSGVEPRARSVIASLRDGGLPAQRESRRGAGELLAALTMPYIAALERAGWSLRTFGPQIALAAGAAREAAAVVAAAHGRPSPGLLATSPLVAKLTFALLERLAPFDLEWYLRTHFTKMSVQTRQMLEGWIAEARSRGLPAHHLAGLYVGLAGAHVGA